MNENGDSGEAGKTAARPHERDRVGAVGGLLAGAAIGGVLWLIAFAIRRWL